MPCFPSLSLSLSLSSLHDRIGNSYEATSPRLFTQYKKYPHCRGLFSFSFESIHGPSSSIQLSRTNDESGRSDDCRTWSGVMKREKKKARGRPDRVTYERKQCVFVLFYQTKYHLREILHSSIICETSTILVEVNT